MHPTDEEWYGHIASKPTCHCTINHLQGRTQDEAPREGFAPGAEGYRFGSGQTNVSTHVHFFGKSSSGSPLELCNTTSHGTPSKKDCSHGWLHWNTCLFSCLYCVIANSQSWFSSEPIPSTRTRPRAYRLHRSSRTSSIISERRPLLAACCQPIGRRFINNIVETAERHD